MIDYAKWADDLESGSFEQGRFALERNGRFCCLGVLSKTQDPLAEIDKDGRLVGGLPKEELCTPNMNKEWILELEDLTDEQIDKLNNTTNRFLSFAMCNDYLKLSFKQIAKIIRDHYVKETMEVDND